MTPSTSNLGILREACIELVSRFDDFWLLAALTDASYEEGDRNTCFKRSIGRYASVGMPESILRCLGDGINGNLRSILQRLNSDLGHISRTKGEGQDLSYEAWPGGSATKIEVKLVFDCTTSKYYSSVAADWDKLALVRARGFAGDLFLVVFFVQLPKYRYPDGEWAKPSIASRSRSQYLMRCDISAQYSQLTRSLLHPPTWPTDEPYVWKLNAAAKSTIELASRRFHLFHPASPWQFDPATHLNDAAVAVAVWQIC